MATKELEEALLRQKTGGASLDPLEMLSEVLEIDVETVTRVAFAYQYMRDASSLKGLSWNERLTPDLRDAIRLAVEAGAVRLQLSQSLQTGTPYHMAVSALLPFDDHRDICNGCAIRLECMADNLHQPDHCYTGMHRAIPVLPVQLTKTHVTVQAIQPAGTYTVPLIKIRLLR